MSALSIWVVTDNPSDAPGKFVARRHLTPGGPTFDCLAADTLEEVRELLPAGLFRIPRDEADDPVIVESWL